MPLKGFDQNRIWCALVALAVEITAWTQLIALPGHPAWRWEPKRLRHRLFIVPAAPARHGRTLTLHLAEKAPWAHLLHDGIIVLGLIYTAPCIGALIGSPVGGALMELDGAGGLHGWQWMFLIEGLVTILVGGLVWRLLPDRPSDAKWLTPEEASLLSQRAAAQDVPVATRVRGNFRLVFGRPVMLVIAAIYFINQAIQSGVLLNFPAVIQELGVDSAFLVGVVAGGSGLTGLAGCCCFHGSSAVTVTRYCSLASAPAPR